MKRTTFKTLASLGTSVSALCLLAASASADQVFADDVIVQGSLCVGMDCVNGENFGADTIRLKENNLRIHFDDTSASASFPNNDWRIVSNDSTNGGANYLAVEDATAGRQVFRLEAGAPVNSLYVDDAGNVGLGTSTPVVELHIVDGDSPTMRLEQNTSSGFAAQTWDVAGNETNFFVRDATNGSLLPFKIRPSAPTNSLYVNTDGNIGLSTASPAAPLHLLETAALNGSSPHVLIQNTNAAVAGRTMMTLSNNGPAFLRLENTNVSADARWVIAHDGTGNLGINRDGSNNEFFLTPTGDLTLTGTLTTAGSCSVGCDRVFEAGYEIPSIGDRAKEMFAKGYLPNVGPTAEDGPFNVSDKMGRMLNELEHAHIYIAQLNERLEMLETKLN